MVPAKLLIMAAAQLSDKQKRANLGIIILIPIGLVIFFVAIFAYKSDHPKDVYMRAAREVATELKTVNRIDGNLIRSIYFLYDDKKTEDVEEIKAFIEKYFVRTIAEIVVVDGKPVKMKFKAFKSYLEIQAMLLLPPFSYTAPEIILINLYLKTPVKEDLGGDYSSYPDWGSDDDDTGGGLPGDIESGNDDNSRPDVLPFRILAPCGGQVTSYFGMRTHPVTGEALSMHTGIDISGTHHQPVASAADGTIVEVNTAPSGYGNYIKVKHTVEGKTFYTFYAHLSKVAVSVGDRVGSGQMIGVEGGGPDDDNPGTSTGHHLHFEVRLTPDRGSCIDPAPYIGR